MITRRAFIQRAGAAAAALYLLDLDMFTPEPASAWSGSDYWAFADRMQLLLEPTWSPSRAAYAPLHGASGTQHNANALLTHAAAAAAGHTGVARQDERARSLAARFCATPPWTGGCANVQPHAAARKEPMEHGCGWGSSLYTVGHQHPVIDTEVVRALAQAYAARAALALPEETVSRIRDRVEGAANSAFYAYPKLRLNQINWPVEIYAHARDVVGSDHLLRHDCGLQLRRFADALTHPAAGMHAPNTGPGYRFHYLPQYSASAGANVDCAEYATIVCAALRFYGAARAAGMTELRPGQLMRLRAWVERVLCGYWTHGGYLNWDTGLGFNRWHQVKKPPLCQHALLAIALTPRFQPTRAHGRWARYLFDRGLELFERFVAEGGGLPPRVLYGVRRTPSAATDPHLAVARMQANAALAWSLGLEQVPAEAPPPLYAYDPDIGRLAVTTPAYNTAVIAVNQGAFPYGGMELARLFDGDQRVAASIGGRPPAAFGVVVRDRRTGRETRSQRGRLDPDLHDPPLQLVRAPRGAVAHPDEYPRRAYAGRFDELEAVGTTTGRDVQIRTRHRFTATFVETSWRITPRSGASGAHDVEVQFPSTGTDAAVTAVLADGRSVPVTDAERPRLADVAWLYLGTNDCGYVVVLRSRQLPGRLRLRHPSSQSSAPEPGPTAALALVHGGALRPLLATARVAPARGFAAAATVADALGAVSAADSYAG